VAGENVDVDEVGRLRISAIDAFKPIVNGKLIEEGVVAFEPELRTENGAAAGSIDDDFAAKRISCRRRRKEAQIFMSRISRGGS
jgi:hypothetical protein